MDYFFVKTKKRKKIVKSNGSGNQNFDFKQVSAALWSFGIKNLQSKETKNYMEHELETI